MQDQKRMLQIVDNFYEAHPDAGPTDLADIVTWNTPSTHWRRSASGEHEEVEVVELTNALMPKRIVAIYRDYQRVNPGLCSGQAVHAWAKGRLDFLPDPWRSDADAFARLFDVAMMGSREDSSGKSLPWMAYPPAQINEKEKATA